MTTPPLISVVVTTFREDPKVLRRALDSVLQQTMHDLELIVVFEKDDPNVDLVRVIPDGRIVVIVNQDLPNRSGCHNLGLAAARGRYLARMDGDDVVYPERLEKQIAFLRAHPEIGVVGAAGRLVDTDGNELGYRRPPVDHEGTMRSLAFSNSILHPVVTWDRERVGYDIRYAIFPRTSPMFRVDDLELWLRMARNGVKFANLPDVLIDYRQPAQYKRPLIDRRGGLQVRLLHWRFGLKYPRFLIGIALMALLVAMPDSLVSRIMGRHWLADRLRSIKAM